MTRTATLTTPTTGPTPLDRWLPWLANGGVAIALRLLLPITLEPSGERYRYYAMSLFFPLERCASFHCFRVLPPMVASLLPLEVADAFVVTGLVFQVAAAVVLWHLARSLTGSSRIAWLTASWYWATWATILALSDPLLITDPVQAFWSLTGLYLLLHRRHALALVMLVAGAAIKESVLLVPMIYALYAVIAGGRSRPSLQRLAVLVAAPLTAWLALRFFLHARYGYVMAEDAAYLRQTYFFGVWLKNLAPWPANLRPAALYIFGSYGAAWIFCVAGFRRSSARQRALTLASIPAMLFLALYQVPDRALASFPYAVLIPAATFTAALPAWLAGSVILVNAAFTIRMNAAVSWLPRTTVLLVILAVLIAAAFVLARRRDPHEEDAAPARSVGLLGWAALTLTALLCCRVAWHALTDVPPLRLGLWGETVAIADDDGGTPGVAISPDGRRLAFVGVTDARVPQLYVRDFTASVETPLNGTEGASAPFWSPDGLRIGFFAGGHLKAISIATGRVDVLATAPHPRGGAWSARDVILFAPEATGGLSAISSGGGPISRITDLSAPQISHRWPSFLPDGTRFFFAAESPDVAARGVYLGSISKAAPKRILDNGSNPTYAAPGLLVFGRDRGVWAVPFDRRRADALGLPTSITRRTATSAAFDRASFSLAGRTMVIGTDTARSALATPLPALRLFDRTGRQIGDRVDDLMRDLTGGEAPDEMWRRVLRGGAWSPDHRRVAYIVDERHRTDLHERTVDGVDRVSATGLPRGGVITTWSPDGSTLLFHAQPTTEHGSWDIWTFPMTGGQATPLRRTAANDVQAHFSPDGKWIAYASDDTGRYEIFVEPYPPTGARWQISTEGGMEPRWRDDGRELLFVVGDRFLAAAPIEPTPVFRAGPPQELFAIDLAAFDPHLFVNYAVGPGGRYVLVSGPIGSPPSGRLAVWLNWTRGVIGL